MLDKATKFLKILTQYTGNYNPEHGRINFTDVDFDALESDLDEIDITLHRPGARAYVEASGLPFNYFETDAELFSKIKPALFQQGLVVVKEWDGHPLIFDYSSFRVFNIDTGEIEHPSASLLDFYLFVEVLCNESKGSNEVNSFIDYYDDFRKEFIVIPKTNPSRINIPLEKPTDIESLPPNRNETIRSLQESLNDNTNPFRVFLKNQIYSHLKDVAPKQRIFEFLRKLREILASAQMDYELYCSELSVDQLKRDYKEYKTKYFEHLTGILSKVSNQVIALPITVLGAAFAISRLTDAPWALGLIALAILSASGVVGYIMYHYLLDLGETQQHVEKDYDLIRNSNFFQSNKDELSDFENIKQGLLRKLESTHNVIKVHFWLLAVFNEFIIAYILHELTVPLTLIFSLVLITLVVPILLFNSCFKNI